MNKGTFLSQLIKALHMDVDDFMYRVSQHKTYELVLYGWMNRLYTKKQFYTTAVRLIYRARHFYFFRNLHPSYSSPRDRPDVTG
ncbi:hypothetical protein [Aquimarina addita]|uniref:hypothetical protein n=1 Tax=Aquimarina addita TaxID=870485 RepID=UPI0031E7796F